MLLRVLTRAAAGIHSVIGLFKKLDPPPKRPLFSREQKAGSVTAALLIVYLGLGKILRLDSVARTSSAAKIIETLAILCES